MEGRRRAIECIVSLMRQADHKDPKENQCNLL